MPTTKKAAKPRAAIKKKAPVKESRAPKKAAPEKAAPKVAPPVKVFQPVRLSLRTNGGVHSLTFSDEAEYKAAMQCIKSAPSQPTGARTNPRYTIRSDDGPLWFQFVSKYSITP